MIVYGFSLIWFFVGVMVVSLILYAGLHEEPNTWTSPAPKSKKPREDGLDVVREWRREGRQK